MECSKADMAFGDHGREKDNTQYDENKKTTKKVNKLTFVIYALKRLNRLIQQRVSVRR